MEDTLKKRVLAWAQAGVATATARRPCSIHLDELLGKSADGGYEVALAAFVALVGVGPSVLDEFVPTLVLPLEGSDRVDFDAPTWLQIREVAFEEPPMLALVHKGAWDIPEPKEEYLRFLSLPKRLRAPPGVDCVAYYKCYRIYSLAVEWGYSRGLYVEARKSAM